MVFIFALLLLIIHVVHRSFTPDRWDTGGAGGHWTVSFSSRSSTCRAAEHHRRPQPPRSLTLLLLLGLEILARRLWRSWHWRWKNANMIECWFTALGWILYNWEVSLCWLAPAAVYQPTWRSLLPEEDHFMLANFFVAQILILQFYCYNSTDHSKSYILISYRAESFDTVWQSCASELFVLWKQNIW